LPVGPIALPWEPAGGKNIPIDKEHRQGLAPGIQFSPEQTKGNPTVGWEWDENPRADEQECKSYCHVCWQRKQGAAR